MNFSIHDDCINCGACQAECSSNAIIKNNSNYMIGKKTYPPFQRKYTLSFPICVQNAAV
jgi:ferredoxin